MPAPSVQAARVAVISDVHGNAVALAAVLHDLAAEEPDLVVSGGDVTWGSLPEETYRLIEPVRHSAIFVRGNAERSLAEAAARVQAGDEDALTARERWMVERHSPAMREFLASSVDSAILGPDVELRNTRST